MLTHRGLLLTTTSKNNKAAPANNATTNVITATKILLVMALAGCVASEVFFTEYMTLMMPTNPQQSMPIFVDMIILSTQICDEKLTG